MPNTIRYILLAAIVCASPLVFAANSIIVEVNGIEGTAKDNVLASLSIEQQKNHPDLSEGRISRLHIKAINEIKKALQPIGFYQPEISSRLRHEKDQWIASYTIRPGKPVIVTEIDITLIGEGKNDDNFLKVKNDFALKPGDILLHNAYESSKTAFLKIGAELGYLDLQLTAHDVIVDIEKATATITLHIDTGPRYRLGEVIFTQDVFDSKLLRGYIPFTKGEYYSTDLLLDLQNALSDSNYFAQVDLKVRRDIAEGLMIPIEVILAPRKKHGYTFGVGYGTDTGKRGSIGWENRRVNPQGHNIKTELNGSEISTSLTARYNIPIRDPRTDSLSFNTAWVREHPVTSHSETFLLGVSRTISLQNNWLETRSLNYQSESFTIADENRHSTLIIPGINWSRVKADNRINTRKGYRIAFDLKTGVGRDTRLMQARSNGKIITSPSDSSRIILRGDVATSINSEFSQVPASLRYFTGGDRSVRGYDYNSLGPENDAGDVIGGRHLIVGSAEYEHTISGKWSGAIFYDVGNALDSFSETLQRGAGFGIRWKSPVGPIRLDYAWALSEPGSPFKFHFVVGPDL